MATVGCPSGSTPPCFASCKHTALAGGWNCSIDHSHPVCGKREGKENRVVLTVATDVEGNRGVVSAELQGGPVTLEPWILPAPEPMQHVHVDDIHGGAWLVLPADMPDLEVARRVALARTIHGPDSDLPCCLAKRKALANDIAA